MKNLSHIVLDGYLTVDPELKQLSGGKVVASFSIAVNHGFKNKDGEDEVSYFDIESWDKLAENAAEYLKKGKKATVIGSLKQERWKNQDGENRSKTKVIASSIRFDSPPDKKEQKAA